MCGGRRAHGAAGQCCVWVQIAAAGRRAVLCVGTYESMWLERNAVWMKAYAGRLAVLCVDAGESLGLLVKIHGIEVLYSVVHAVAARRLRV